MNITSLKGNIDRKIERYIKVDKISLTEICDKLNTTKNNFQKMLDMDVNSSPRLHIMTLYIKFSVKRIKDIENALDNYVNNYFFAGATDLDIFKLIKLRDKVSQDVLESEFC